jgi:hypothetical protein
MGTSSSTGRTPSPFQLSGNKSVNEGPGFSFRVARQLTRGSIYFTIMPFTPKTANSRCSGALGEPFRILLGKFRPRGSKPPPTKENISEIWRRLGR